MKTNFATAAFALFAATNVHAAVYTVRVGMDERTGTKGIGFDPSSVGGVHVDDIMDFVFLSGFHSVVESTFQTPCLPKEGGFDSGAFTVSDSLNETAPGLPSVQFTITTTQPYWFFDQSGGTCNQGGTFSVNPTVIQPDAEFKAAASSAVEVAPTSTSSAPDSEETGSPPNDSESSSEDGGDDTNNALSPINMISIPTLLLGGLGIFGAALI